MWSKNNFKFAGLLLVQLALVFAFQARADEDDPSSRVARIAYADGSVSFEPAGTDDWVAAGLNRPMTTGDKIWSDKDGRVELQLDGSLLRLSQNTGCSFLNLSDNVTQVQLTAGTLLVRVRRLAENETYEVNTPNLAFSLLRPGLYRIGVNENGDATVIVVRSGEGEVTGGGAAYTVHATDAYIFSGTDQLNATPEDSNEQDQFDAWSDTRDRRWGSSRSSHYVSDDVIGYEDLDQYGTWRQVPTYGYVWFPRTPESDWAPYHYGHWDYIQPWGYTWVDDQPWGFAPFHYGRWMNYEGGWGWVPAPPRTESTAYVAPVYAPALVAWQRGVAGADVAWFALGPREVYVPSYPVSRNYVERVNVSNTTVNTTIVNNYYNTTVVNKSAPTNIAYVNRNVPGAVIGTSSQAFTTAQPVAKNAVRVDQRSAANGRVVTMAPPLAPLKQAVLGSAPAKSQPPTKVESRAVVAKATPPPPPPSFEKTQEAIKSNGGKPLSVAQRKQIEPAAAHQPTAVKIAPPAKPAAVPPPHNRTAPPSTTQPAKNSTGTPSNRPADRPPSANESRPQPNQPPPSGAQPKPTNRPPEHQPEGKTPSNPPAPARSDRPPTAAPVHPNEQPPTPRAAQPPSSSPGLEKKQQQEQEQLRERQEQERQRLQRQQEQEHAKPAAQQADQAQKQRMEQQHQQQTQQQQQKHTQEQKQMEQKQQQERKNPGKPQPEHAPQP